MYCSQCGKEIPENSKFCNECGSPVIEKKEPNQTTNSQYSDIFSNSTYSNQTKKVNTTISVNETKKTNYNTSNNDKIRKPNAFLAVILIYSTILCFIVSFATIQDSFLKFLFILILSFVVLGYTIGYIKDYNLAQQDFQKYKQKVIQERLDEKAAEEAQKRIQIEAEENRRNYVAKGIPTCPKCGSHSIATMNRGYSIVWGFIGSGKPVNVCQICGHKWQIGK